MSGDLQALAAALEAGADVDLADEFGSPPLVSAALHGRLQVVMALLDAGADVAARVRGKHDTALHCAASHGRLSNRDGRDLSEQERECYLPMLGALLAAGADLSAQSDGRTPLALAIEFASASLVQAILDAGGDATTGTPLVLALGSRREPMAKLEALLRAGAGLDSASGAPLAMAASELLDERAVHACTLLLLAGAPIDQVTIGGWSALTHAVAAENLPLVEMLLARGARADLPITHDEKQASLSPGMTAARIASHWGLDAISAAIRAAGKAADADLPMARERLVGRWHLVAVRTDHDGDMHTLAKDDWADLGAHDGHLELHPDGRLEGQHMSEIRGTWSMERDTLVLLDENEDSDSVTVSMAYGNRQIVLAYDDDFGPREFWFEHD